MSQSSCSGSLAVGRKCLSGAGRKTAGAPRKIVASKGAVAAPGKAQARVKIKPGAGIAKAGGQRGRSSTNESDSDVSKVDLIMEEVLSVTYVSDYLEAVDSMDDVARHNSQVLNVHCDQISLLNEIESSFTSYLESVTEGNNNDSEDRTNARGESFQNLESLLMQAIQINDKGTRDTDKLFTIVEDKLHLLQLDKTKLECHQARPDNLNLVVNHPKAIKKPSMNPEPQVRSTPSKMELVSKADNYLMVPIQYPAAFSSTGCDSPAPSVDSSSSFDNKSGKDSQRSVDSAFLEDSRYRACKFRNPPTYVFNARQSISNTTTTKDSDCASQSKPSEEENDSAEKAPAFKFARNPSVSSQGSFSKRDQGTDTAEDSLDSSSDSGSDRSIEPKYCVCEKVSHGKMIQCDNDLCPIEWFHFKCVGVKKIPKGDWFCPRCRGENSSVMKPRAEFFRDLDKFNKDLELQMLQDEC